MYDAGHNTPQAYNPLTRGFCLTDLSTASLLGAAVALSTILWFGLAAIV